MLMNIFRTFTTKFLFCDRLKNSLIRFHLHFLLYFGVDHFSFISQSQSFFFFAENIFVKFRLIVKLLHLDWRSKLMCKQLSFDFMNVWCIPYRRWNVAGNLHHLVLFYGDFNSFKVSGLTCFFVT